MRSNGLAAAAVLLAGMGLAAIAALSGGKASAAVTADEARCAALAAPEQTSAKWVPADAAAGLPAFCEVTGVLSPVEGSRIGVVYRLPEHWNGKLLGLGGSGWAGVLTLQAASEGLKAGYATAQTDGGHATTDVWDNSWAANPVQVDDFAFRAVHEMTVAGKQLVAAWYGRAHERAYFQGCSTGGRMAMMEAQRFPEDYDAISAGAPVYTLQVQTSAVLRSNLFSRPGAGFTADQFGLVNRAVLKACDANDGLADGIVNDPGACGWDPAASVCKPGDAAESCISETQAETLRTAYSGIRAANGEWAMLPLAKGGEPGWIPFIGADGKGLSSNNTGGIITLGGPLLGDAAFDFAHFGPGDATRARSSAFATVYEAKDPDISRFIARGGKLLLWHGMNDQAPNYLATADYVGKAEAAVSGARNGLRYFALPGVPHCRGGPGADTIDLLGALDSWVGSGQAPDTLIATRATAGLTRKICAWPKVAQYRGSGDGNDLAGWECVSTAS